MTTRYVFAFGATLALMPGAAQADSIYQALSFAYNSNSTLNAQRAATRANDENLVQAKSGFRPAVFATADAGVTYTRTNQIPTAGGVITTPSGGYGISIEQNLFNGFRTVNSIKSAKAGVLASRATLRNVEQNTLLQASTAYVDVLLNTEIVGIRRRNIEFLSEQFRSSQARLEVGEGTRTDLAQSEAQLALARAQLSAAIAALESSKAVYRQVIGRAPSNLRWPNGPVKLYPHTLSEARSLAESQHPSVKATRHAVDAAAFNVKVSEGAFLPTLSATGSAQRRFTDPSNSNDTDVSSLEGRLALRVPLYQQGAASSAVRQNKQLLSQRRIQVDEAIDAVRQEVVSAWTQLQAARANLQANSQQVSAGRLALAGVVEERNVGQRTQLDVLNTQSTLLQAQELQVTSRRNLVAAGYRLVAAVGRLNSRKLNLRVAHYSPKAHFRQVKDKWYGLRTPSGR